MPNPRDQVHLNLPPDLKRDLKAYIRRTYDEHRQESVNAWFIALIETVIYEARAPHQEGVQS